MCCRYICSWGFHSAGSDYNVSVQVPVPRREGQRATGRLLCSRLRRSIRGLYMQWRIHDFGQEGGPSGVLTPGGALSPKFAPNEGIPKITWKLHDFEKIKGGARASMAPWIHNWMWGMWNLCPVDGLLWWGVQPGHFFQWWVQVGRSRFIQICWDRKAFIRSILNEQKVAILKSVSWGKNHMSPCRPFHAKACCILHPVLHKLNFHWQNQNDIWIPVLLPKCFEVS